MSQSKPKSFRPGVTHLENREVPAVSTVQVFNGVLTVLCDNNATSVMVGQSPGAISVQDLTSNRFFSFSSAAVGRIDVFGGAGNDTLASFGPAGSRLVRLFGGGGADALSAFGKGSVEEYGGAGNDTLKGGGGSNRLVGGAGNDTLIGGNGGSNNMDGGNGDDYIKAGIGGSNTLTGGGGNDTLVAINGGTNDILDPGLGFDVLWVDKNGSTTDHIVGPTTGKVVNAVASFANGADLTLDGDRLSNPTVKLGDTYETFAGRPLFGPLGPTVNDIRQGVLGDCWVLAGLGAVAKADPNVIRADVVDFRDGTYGVHLGNAFFRVDNDLPVAASGNQFLTYTALGQGGSVWVSIIEKAYTYYQATQILHVPASSANYANIEGGLTFNLYQALNLSGAGSTDFNQFGNAFSLGLAIRNAVDNNQAPTLGIGGDTPQQMFNPGANGMLLANHQYIVMGYQTDGLGFVTNIVLRNPWGIDGSDPAAADSNPNDGIITISIDTLYACRLHGSCTLDSATVPNL
jgi:Calpain family cysteine protease/RTX calcium-binding nonapeptide repeat (4 copies)